MSVFTWRAEVASSGTGEFAMYSSRFGDGYSQDVPAGQNNERQKWSVVVSGYGPQHRQVLAFLRGLRGQPFQWKAPNTDALGWYKCVRYSQGDEGGDYWTLTMEFEQSFAP